MYSPTLNGGNVALVDTRQTEYISLMETWLLLSKVLSKLHKKLVYSAIKNLLHEEKAEQATDNREKYVTFLNFLRSPQ